MKSPKAPLSVWEAALLAFQDEQRQLKKVLHAMLHLHRICTAL